MVERTQNQNMMQPTARLMVAFIVYHFLFTTYTADIVTIYDGLLFLTRNSMSIVVPVNKFRDHKVSLEGISWVS